MDSAILRDAGQIFQEEHKLIELPSYGKAVFAGDTHGDWEASQAILEAYPAKKYVRVFLGDYVDRGYDSKKNIDLLLEAKVRNRDRTYLLLGNHEVPEILAGPRGFWDSLEPEEKQDYERVLGKLPLAASGSGLIALHGAPPDLRPFLSEEELKDPNASTLHLINKIKPESDPWLQIIWGDLSESDARQLYTPEDSLRRCYGMRYFADVMDDLHKEVLIRSHDPRVPEVMLGGRCLTLMTSTYYAAIRKVAIADLGKETNTVDDLTVEVV